MLFLATEPLWLSSTILQGMATLTADGSWSRRALGPAPSGQLAASRMLQLADESLAAHLDQAVDHVDDDTDVVRDDADHLAELRSSADAARSSKPCSSATRAIRACG